MSYNAEKALKEARRLNLEVASLLGKERRTIEWNFGWNAHHTHGKCIHIDGLKYRILISKSLISEKDVKNTVLHELCHAYAPLGSHHGPAWKAIANEVGRHFGETITRTSNKKHDADSRKPFAEIRCPVCGRVDYLWKRTSYAYRQTESCWCSHCGERKTKGKLIKRILR